jgi:D-glycero-alpha-D-manno-heptose-7-phosphate kinase
MQKIVASAPTRIDLAGGTLDIWPIYLYFKGATTINVAIDRRAVCTVEPCASGFWIESQDTGVVQHAASLDELIAARKLPLIAAILDDLQVRSGVRLTVASNVPAGSGLGGSSALAIVTTAALARWLGQDLSGDTLLARVRDIEARSIGIPTGIQDYHAAIRGRVSCMDLKTGSPVVTTLPVATSEIESRVSLFHSGQTRFSGINNWEVFKRQIDGDSQVRTALTEIAEVADSMAGMLRQGAWDTVPGLIRREWQARKRLAPQVTTPEIDRLVAIAERHDAAGKVCGAGGGGLTLIWSEPRQQAALRRTLANEGFQAFDYRVDTVGLDIAPGL